MLHILKRLRPLASKLDLPFHHTASSKNLEGRWTDGLRGLASVLVMTSHIIRAFAPYITEPAASPNKPLFWQLPFARLIGAHWVAIFFILLGYANTISPVRKSQHGDVAGALTGLASSSARRLIRLILPTFFASFGSWIICQCGGYNLALRSDSSWLNYSSPMANENFADAVRDYFTSMWSLWTAGSNRYDPNMWTMSFLLKGSFFLYMALLVTLRATSRARMLAFGALYLYCWLTADVTIGINIVAGALLAEWSVNRNALRLPDSPISEKHDQAPRKCTGLRRTLPSIILIIVALYLCGFPDIYPEWSPYYLFLRDIGARITPASTEMWRLYPSIGGQMIIVAIILSPSLQSLFAAPFLLWLGKMSFPIYLIHGSLLRSVLTWMIYSMGSTVPRGRAREDGTQEQWDEAVAPKSLWVYAIATPVWVALVLLCASLWNKYIESWCIRITKIVEDATNASLI